MKDYRGCEVSGASLRALELYEAALGSLQRGDGDALALARLAIAQAPAFVAARQLECALLLSSRDVRDFEAVPALAAAMATLPCNEREWAHGIAIAAASLGDYARAAAVYDEILQLEPRDAMALATVQAFDYFLGDARAQRERAARILAAYGGSVPGRHAVLSAHAFGLVETGEYAAAEAAAMEALALEPRDLRAYHVVAHVLEMQGRAEDGLRWTAGRELSPHLWWHRALFFLAAGDARRALALYDARLQGSSLPVLIDASALLWRLHLGGAGGEDRFAALAERWAPYAEDAHCAFNDLHAMMAFAGARREDYARRLLGAQERRLEQARGANHDMTRLVGYPACRALAAFGRGDYAAAASLLHSLPPVAHRIGGSHAQRDVLTLTRAAAVSRRARRFHGERLATAPSPALAAA